MLPFGKTSLNEKSSNEDIRNRFDNDVERFSNLETGQCSVIDADLMMDLITKIANEHNPDAQNVLDIGCGAGNNTLKFLQLNNSLNCDLIDLSLAMLQRAEKRVSQKTTGKISIFHEDFRTAALKENHYDIIIGAAVFHHLREDDDWEKTFSKVYKILKPNGIFLVTDVITHENKVINNYIWKCQSEHLIKIGGEEYRNKVFDYIDMEDSPRPLTYQTELLRKIGFTKIDILHKNATSTAYCGIK